MLERRNGPVDGFLRDQPPVGMEIAAGRTRPPRVIVTPLEPPLIHPLSKRDVQLVISVLPPSLTAGLRSVSLLGDRVSPEGLPVFASYRRLGFLRLHAVSSLPWRVPLLPADAMRELRQFGAEIQVQRDTAVILWDDEALRLFYTLGVFLPGIARHRRERDGEGEAGADIRWLAGPREPWLVTELALQEWGDLLRRAGGL